MRGPIKEKIAIKHTGNMQYDENAEKGRGQTACESQGKGQAIAQMSLTLKLIWRPSFSFEEPLTFFTC